MLALPLLLHCHGFPHLLTSMLEGRLIVEPMFGLKLSNDLIAASWVGPCCCFTLTVVPPKCPYRLVTRFFIVIAQAYAQRSDHLAIVATFNGWLSARAIGGRVAALDFAKTYHASDQVCGGQQVVGLQVVSHFYWWKHGDSHVQ